MTSVDNYDSLTTSEVIPELNTSGQSLTGGKKKIGRYEVMRILGRGAFGTVKLALDPETQTYVSFFLLFLLIPSRTCQIITQVPVD